MIDVQPNSTRNRFRAARVARLRALASDYVARKGSCAVLDIGGTENFWHTWREYIDLDKVHVTCVNISTSHARDPRSAVAVQYGDATDLNGIADKSYDLAFSNSVIEHVGQWSQMVKYANEARRVARSYLIQTPYFWFPIEPHARTPLLHWLPESLAYRVVMMRKCGFWRQATSVDGAMRTLQSAKMLDRRQFAALFDDGEIVLERYLGLVKSLIAVRHPPV